MKTWIKIFLVVLVIAGTIFVGVLDMYSTSVGNAAWGLSYIPLELRAFLYLVIMFLLIAIIQSFTD